MSAMNKQLVVIGSTKLSLHERFTNLKKTEPQPVQTASYKPPEEDIYDKPGRESDGSHYFPRYEHSVQEYRGPLRTATSMPVYDRYDLPPHYRSPPFERRPPYRPTPTDDVMGLKRRQLKHRLGYKSDYYLPSELPSRGGYVRNGRFRANYPRGYGGRSRGYNPRVAPYQSRFGKWEDSSSFDGDDTSARRGYGRGHWGGGRRGSRGGFNDFGHPVSKEELDSELDSYMSSFRDEKIGS